MGFSKKDVEAVAEELGLDWNKLKFTSSDLAKGMKVELEHGTRSADTNITEDDPVKTAKIALAHLNEFADYYDRLAKMEKEAKEAVKEKEASVAPPSHIKYAGCIYELLPS